jgi:hypothetical protein
MESSVIPFALGGLALQKTPFGRWPKKHSLWWSFVRWAQCFHFVMSVLVLGANEIAHVRAHPHVHGYEWHEHVMNMDVNAHGQCKSVDAGVDTSALSHALMDYCLWEDLNQYQRWPRCSSIVVALASEHERQLEEKLVAAAAGGQSLQDGDRPLLGRAPCCASLVHFVLEIRKICHNKWDVGTEIEKNQYFALVENHQ